MTNPERLDRKELKQPDQFQEAVDTGAEWIHEHLKTILGIAAGIVAAAVLWVGYGAWDRGREAKAATAMAGALDTLDAAIVDVGAEAKPDDPKDPSFADEAARAAAAKAKLEQVIAEFGGTDAGRVADVYLGRLAADAGDLATARTHWERFVAKADGDLLVPSVRVALLRLDRAEGKAEAALAYLEKAAAPGGKSELPADVVLFELATTYESLDRGEDARASYQRVVDEFPESAWVQSARQRLNVLNPPAAA